jgi:arsenical-resistance protein
MSLLGFGKKKEEPACACNGSVETFEADAGAAKTAAGLASVKVLGSGCKSCRALLVNTNEALKAMAVPFEAEYVTDMAAVASYGVMSTPALVVNEKVVYTVVQVATNDIIILFAFVPIVKFLLGVSNVSVPYSTLILSVVLFVVVPLAAGILTRTLVVRRRGDEYFEKRFVHKFDSATTVGLLLTLVMVFMFQSEVILKNPLHILLIAVPLVIQTYLIFFIAYFACRILKLPYDISAPAGMIGASNFFELSVAVAVALFGTTSPAALATTVGVLTEVPVMLTLVKIANKTKGWFPDKG